MGLSVHPTRALQLPSNVPRSLTVENQVFSHLYYELLCLLPSLIIFKTAKVVFWHCGTKPEVFLSQIWQ